MNSASAGYDVILTCNYSPWSTYLGGGQKSTHMVATAMAGMGLKVCVIYSKAWRERIAVPTGLKYDIAWAFFFAVKPGISSPLRFLNGIAFFFAARKRCGPGTVVHGNGDEASLLGLIRRKRKFVYSNRYPAFEAFLAGADWRSPWTWLKVLVRDPRYVAMALAMRRAETVFCTSADSARRVTENFQVPSAKIRVVPNGIDPAFFATLPGAKRAAQAGLLYFGRLTRAKGVADLLRAYAAMPDALRDKHILTLIGDGPLWPELQKLAASLGISERLRRTPWMGPEALAREIASVKLVVLPSHEESFGNTMLETLAAGQRLLTTDAGSIPEVVGDFATQVPVGNVEALKVEMIRLLQSEPDPDAAQKQVEYVRGRFSWEGSARMFAETYHAKAALPS